MEEKGKWKSKSMKSMKLTLALAMAVAAMPLASHAYVWTSCAQYGTYSSGGYEFYCDEWGSTASECCNLNSVTSWNVVSSVPTGGGVKAYPNTARNNIGKTVSAYSSSSSYNWSAPGGTYWDASFDCWVPTEVMVWEGNSGGVGPSGSKVYSNQSIDGASWNVYWQGGGPSALPPYQQLRVGFVAPGHVLPLGRQQGLLQQRRQRRRGRLRIRNLRIGQLAYVDHEQLLHRNLILSDCNRSQRDGPAFRSVPHSLAGSVNVGDPTETASKAAAPVWLALPCNFGIY